MFKACTIRMFMRAQLLESGPPVGTVLGNIGLNAVKFTKDFNEFTKDLPSYFSLKVTIAVLEDRSYTFTVAAPSTGFIINLLKFDRIFSFFGKSVNKSCINLKSLVQLALFKFPRKNLKKSIPIICGSVYSAKIIIVF
jgi:ribosomal protein L11